MKQLSDFHTHTSFADGKRNVSEMVESAYRMGLEHYGLSEHLYSSRMDWGCKGTELDRYMAEVADCKKKYAGKMNILCGLEVENNDGGSVLTESQKQNTDYYICSTHELEIQGHVFFVDNSAEELKSMVERFYSGDWFSLVRHYFREASSVRETLPYSFFGHFDLITKFNQDDVLFRTDCDDFIQPALEAMERLLSYDIPFEINTGAISRGHRQEPYPSAFLLKELCCRGGRIIINSDAHHPDNICFRYDQASKLAYDCGFREKWILTASGMKKEIL